MDLFAKEFGDYELIDAGGGRKLERFGTAIIDRPSPGAIWRADMRNWNKASAAFNRGEGGTGDWEMYSAKDFRNWRVRLENSVFELRLTGFGNIGLFPEHICHWSWMRDSMGGRSKGRVLNLFAYTGAVSMACADFGAEVTHVDSAKAVNSWAMANAKLSGTKKGSIRFITDDATKFVKRELRRKSRYDGIILDPPTFGRGARGEVWKIERDLVGLVGMCGELLSDDPAFVLLTSHSPGVTPSVLENLLGINDKGTETGEMVIRGGCKHPLPSGAFARWSSMKSTALIRTYKATT